MAKASGYAAPTESDVARLYSRYAGNQNKIESDYAAKQSELLQNYYANREAEQNTAYDRALERINTGTMDNDELSRYIESVRGQVSAAQASDLDLLRENYLKDPLIQQNLRDSKAAMDEIRNQDEAKNGGAQAVQHGTYTYYNGVGNLDSAGNNFTLTDKDGVKYKVESGGEIGDEAVLAAAENVADGGVFGYNGAIYIRQNRKVYLIRKRPSQGSKAGATKGYDRLYQNFFGETQNAAETTDTAENVDGDLNAQIVTDERVVRISDRYRDGSTFQYGGKRYKKENGNVYLLD